jgi:hypothetical protein
MLEDIVALVMVVEHAPDEVHQLVMVAMEQGPKGGSIPCQGLPNQGTVWDWLLVSLVVLWWLRLWHGPLPF